MLRYGSSKLIRRSVAALLSLTACVCANADTILADKPIGSTVIVPANVILDLSVEFPTAVTDAYFSIGSYATGTEFTGYFNPNFCYDYKKYTGSDQRFGVVNGYFVPISGASAHVCNTGLSATVTRYWSGNFLNWTLTQTIDSFRQTLTGGARIIDMPSLTVLQKAYQDNQGGSSNQYTKSLGTAALVAGATPFLWNSFNISNYRTGLGFVFSGKSMSGLPVAGTPYEGVVPQLADQTKIYRAQGAVQVCTTADSSDVRCRAYGNNFKPVGLMQKYAAENSTQIDSIRYAAFGYLNDPADTTANRKIDGGVLRAKMKSVGPFQANPGTTPSANGNAEWAADTGIFVLNPNSTDASATPSDSSDPAGGVSNSGVISYLNNFGFSAANGSTTAASAYKRFDPVSELYYAATRYYRGMTNVAAYSSNSAVSSGEATNDNFPVITAWDDPIKYSCSPNYIIGIGDIHTHDDANLPGATPRSGNEPTKPSEVVADSVDAAYLTDYIAKLENLAGLTGGGSNDYTLTTGIGDQLIPNVASPSGGSNFGGDDNTFNMAGLAYDVHTRDIRTDIPNKSKPVTVSTFWLDVMEGNVYNEKNQFWLTAKYGGFDTSTSSFPSGYQEISGTPAALPVASWNTGGYKDDHNNLAPDQYFQASSPTKMAAGLNAAFGKIQANIPTGTSTGLALASSSVTASGNANYAASFGANWTGEVVGETVDETVAAGAITTNTTVVWHASYWLPPYTATSNPGVTPLTAATRIIATSFANGAGKGVPFKIGSISGTEQGTLGSGSAATDVLNYIRGDGSKETTNGGTFRPRGNTLGDITNSKLQLVSAPSAPYADAPLNPGYSAFKATYAARPSVIYVGANDGMLHAFNASLTASGGKELFAYVPSYLFNTNVDSSGNPVGLASLAVNPLQHHFMVDAQPTILDTDFARVGTGWAGVATGTTNWHTLLVSGLGKGGKGFFALDITDPSSVTSESALAGKVLWETDPAVFAHMGYSYGTPLVTKTKRWGWTVVLTSGYGNDDGKGYIYLVNPKDGSLYETISTGAGSTASPAGLAFVGGFTNNVADFTADALYAGDLLGNVWRVDLTSGSSTTVAKLAVLTDPGSGLPQPVTTEPVIQADPATLTRYVFVGTGRLLADTDLVNAQTQTFYSFIDGTNTALGTISAPITRTNLVANASSTLSGVTFSATSKGYYIDLASYAAGAGAQASAERINIQPVAAAGAVAFSANLYGQDVCSGGSSRIFTVGYQTNAGIVGSSLIHSGSNPYVTVSPLSGAVTGLTLVTNGSSGGLQILAGTSGGGITGASLNNTAAALQRLNWREVPNAQ